MIRLEKNDRVLEQILLLQMIKHLSDQLVGRRDEGCVLVPRVRQVLVAEPPLVRPLQRIMRPVDCPINEERLGFPPGYEAFALLDHEIPKVFSIPPDFPTLLPQVMTIGTVPVKEVTVVVDAPPI